MNAKNRATAYSLWLFFMGAVFGFSLCSALVGAGMWHP